MGKTISLKLTQQEEEIINSMRNEGISPSIFIRKAFWKYVGEKSHKNLGKGYKEVNPVNHFSQEKSKIDNRKVYKKVNLQNQKSHEDETFLREKMVYPKTDYVEDMHAAFLDRYIDQLTEHIQQLELEVHEWKIRYTAETQYWKDAYQSLQEEFQYQVKDSAKRIDDRLDHLIFYGEEYRKFPYHTIDIHSEIDTQQGRDAEKQKKRWPSHMVRM